MKGKHEARHGGASRKRIAALAVALTVLCSVLPARVYATGPNEYLCGHVHDASCGYVEGSEGTPCTHEHDESCYTQVLNCPHVCEHVCNHVCGAECEAQVLQCQHVCGDECFARVLSCQHVCGDECASGCVHVHDESCYTTINQCVHVHDAGCYVMAQQCVHTHDESCGALCSHVHDESCYVTELSCQHVHDESCGYSEPVAAAPCTHVCYILGFDGFVPGTPYSTFNAAGLSYYNICEALPDYLRGTLQCTGGSADIPVKWTCPAFTGEAGEYAFTAQPDNLHCAYAAVDDPYTEYVNEGELPYILVTVPETIEEETVSLSLQSESAEQEPADTELPTEETELEQLAEGEIAAAAAQSLDEPTEEASSEEETPEDDPAGEAEAGENPTEQETAEEESEPQCTCTAKCTDESINADCPVCSADHTACGYVEQLELVLPLYELEERELEKRTEDGALIRVKGLLPVSAVLEATVIPVENVSDFVEEGAVVLFAYDIKLMIPAVQSEPETGEPLDGQTQNDALPEMTEYQPSVPVTVSIIPPEDKSIDAPVEVTHVDAQNNAAPVNAETVDGAVEFEAEGFSVYVVTIGTNTPRVTFSYDDSSLTVEYSTDNSTYTVLNGAANYAVSLPSGVTSLYFRVTGGTTAGAFRDGTTAMTDDGGVYTVNNITSNTIITIATAVTLDVTYGTIVIGENDGSGGRKYTFYEQVGGAQQTGVHVPSNIYTITGVTGTSSNGSGYNISLTGDGDFNVVLNSVTIYTGTPGEYTGVGICAPVSTSRVTGTGNINITLVGTNTLKNVSGNPSSSYAALEKTTNSSTLIINGPGTLYATGGADSAGIGSSDVTNVGTKNIIINGGTIYATSIGSQGAGIGSGNNSPAESIRIYGGNITAIGINNGAGIGGSGSANHIATSGQVYIYGGTITAISNGTGAGIGGGGTGTGNSATGGTGEVHIYGGTIIADNIGGGDGGSGGGQANITISGGTISADSISGGHGAGGAHAGGTLTVTGGSAKVEHVCPVIEPKNTNDSALLTYNVLVINQSEPVPNAKVTAFTVNSNNYGLNDVYTDNEGRLYFWLPQGTQVDSVTVKINGVDTECATSMTQAAASITPAATNGRIDFGEELRAVLSYGTATEWRWEKHSNGVWTAISDATASSYLPTVYDVGEIRVVINNTYTSASVFINPPQLSVTVPTSMLVTVNAAGECSVSDGSIINNSAVPVYVTGVSYAWMTDGSDDADNVFANYAAVLAKLTLNGSEYSFSGLTPVAAHPTAAIGSIAAINGADPGTLPLDWDFSLGSNNYINIVPATDTSVQVATVTYTIDYRPPA